MSKIILVMVILAVAFCVSADPIPKKNDNDFFGFDDFKPLDFPKLPDLVKPVESFADNFKNIPDKLAHSFQSFHSSAHSEKSENGKKLEDHNSKKDVVDIDGNRKESSFSD